MVANGQSDAFPNPIKQRKQYRILDKGWEFSLDGKEWSNINVPYCPQSVLSGIGYTDVIRRCFYRKNFHHSKCDGKVILHFGAVDYRAVVSVNGHYIGTHTGGFTPFEFDITSELKEGANEIAVTVYDENENMAFGKQSYKLISFGCFYTRITGIWQPVWLEYVPDMYIKEFYLYPDIDACEVGVKLLTTGCGPYEITVMYEGRVVGRASGHLDYKTEITIPLAEKHLWDIGQGKLYDVLLRFGTDEVSSYFGLRKVEYQGYKFLLNGKEVFQKLVLDQGYNPKGLYTAPSDADLQRDIELGIALGFNGVRLHQKVFEPKYLYLCDKAGYMVWGEYPSWGIDYSNLDSLGQFLAEWQEALKRDFNHPSIIHWCPLNEVWQDWQDAKKKPDIRFVDSVYEFTKQFDSTRPCVDVSGGFHGANTDLYDFHCYESVENIKKYLDTLEKDSILDVPLLSCEGISKSYDGNKPVSISECGGIALGEPNKNQVFVCNVNEGAVQAVDSWGYGKGETDSEVFVERYCELTELLLGYEKLSGYCYTQLYDIEQECNGFYYYDRSDKLTEEQKARIRECQSKR